MFDQEYARNDSPLNE